MIFVEGESVLKGVSDPIREANGKWVRRALVS